MEELKHLVNILCKYNDLLIKDLLKKDFQDRQAIGILSKQNVDLKNKIKNIKSMSELEIRDDIANIDEEIKLCEKVLAKLKISSKNI